MKRFTETTKWSDPWFMELSTTAKLLWLYLLDNCDNSGVINFNPKLASVQIGQTIKPEYFTELGDRLKTLTNGKILIPKFIAFQFGTLGTDSRVHSSVIKMLESHGLQYPIDTLSIPYVKGLDTLMDKDKDKDKERGYGGKPRDLGKVTIEECRIHAVKIGIPESEGERFWNYYESNGWKVGKNPMKNWHSGMANWKKNYEERNGARQPHQPESKSLLQKEVESQSRQIQRMFL